MRQGQSFGRICQRIWIIFHNANLSDSQKVKFTMLYIVVMLILCGTLCGVTYVVGKSMGEAVYYLLH